MRSAVLTDAEVATFEDFKVVSCPFCDERTDVPAWSHKIAEHLIVTIDEKGHCHIHASVWHKKEILKRMLDNVQKELQNYDS